MLTYLALPAWSLTSIEDRGLKEWHAAEAPKDPREALHQLALQS